ncbi:MAG: DUF3786 domain-containing protein, partial [Desulfobia sp.]
SGLNQENTGQAELDHSGDKRDQEFINLLKEKINRLDLSAAAKNLGATFSRNQENTLNFRYLGQDILLNRDHILIDNKEPLDPRDQILLYNYVYSGGGKPPEGTWIGLENLPNSISKVRTMAVYCEDKLAKYFSGRPYREIIQQTTRADGDLCSTESADLCLTVKVLPRVPQQILFWEADPEEGFPVRVKILYDAGVMEYLDLESLVFSSERMADRIIPSQQGSEN